MQDDCAGTDPGVICDLHAGDGSRMIMLHRARSGIGMREHDDTRAERGASTDRDVIGEVEQALWSDVRALTDREPAKPRGFEVREMATVHTSTRTDARTEAT